MLQHLVVFQNPFAQLVDQLQQRRRCPPRLLRQMQIGMFGEPSAGALRHARPEALDQTSHPVDQLRASLEDQIPCPHQVQIPLRFRAAMPDRRQQRRLGPSHLGQRPRILRIVFLIAGGQQPQPPRIRHNHFVTAFPQQRAHPP
jgi:hypothetical protein